MPFWRHDGLLFRYHDGGHGLPFVFQHGLGGDLEQPCGLFAPPPDVRLVSLDCRAHGQTTPVGDAAKIRIAAFADDLASLLDHLAVRLAVLGGISMGAAVALNFALRYPDRTRGLVLSRPAWLDGPMPRNADLFGTIALFIRDLGAAAGREAFQNTDAYRRIENESPDAARSLLNQFTQPRAAENVVRLERIPQDAPCHDLRELGQIRVPTLVLANRQDPIHPLEYGQVLAARIPGARFREITPKSVSMDQHQVDVQSAIAEFLVECRNWNDPHSSGA